MSEEPAKYYDNFYKASKVYRQPWREFHQYADLWQRTAILLRELNVESVLDIGCGMGHFGTLCAEYNIAYTGLDFSAVAIEYARTQDKEGTYVVADALNTIHTSLQVGAYVSHEFLEHIERDRELLQRLNPGTPFVFSVPRFDAKGHVRFFPQWQDVQQRFGPFLNILRMEHSTKKLFLCSGVI